MAAGGGGGIEGGREGGKEGLRVEEGREAKKARR